MTVEEWVDEIRVWHGQEARNQAIKVMRAAINAAVAEDRKTRPHMFIGRTDRDCELCGEPDRDEIHIASREMMRNRVNLSIGREREACAAIADWVAEEHLGETAGQSVAYEIAQKIRARSNPAE